ncbi:MAG: oxidoreductase [Firmicutes bacterium]|nr:oxidoreductase [Bacillota bacterium]
MMREEFTESRAGDAYSISAAALAEAGFAGMPEQLISNRHLIYSSPATLAFNSPGAQGFGVKRAGLSIPGSVMLLVAPACCGRNTTILTELGGYGERFFYLMMDDTDIVTGRHMNRIPQAVKEVYDHLSGAPSVIMICITCVDALLGTDMERICRKAEGLVGIPVLPCYMYALTREGRKPPMVHVRQTLYSLLQPLPKKSTSVNLLGHFAPLIDDCELYEILRNMGVRKIREISRCGSYEEYLQMAEANFNLVLDPEARFAAEDLRKRLEIPSIELRRLYQIDKIQHQYRLFGAALGETIQDETWYEETKKAVESFRNTWGPLRFAVGEGCNANAFELSAALLSYGFAVTEIFADPSEEDFIYIRRIAAVSPDTRIYSNLEPTMLYYDIGNEAADIVIGKDAGYYHPDSVRVEWSDDTAPFGYAGVRLFFRTCEQALRESGWHREEVKE